MVSLRSFLVVLILFNFVQFNPTFAATQTTTSTQYNLENRDSTKKSRKEDLRTRREKRKKSGREVLSEIGKNALAVGAAATAAMILQYWQSPDNFNLVRSLYNSLGGSMLFASLTSQPLREFAGKSADYISSVVPWTKNQDSLAKLEHLEEIYESKREHFPEKTQIEIERVIKDAFAAIQNKHGDQTTKLLERLVILVTLPDRMKIISMNDLEVKSNLEKIFENSQPEVRERLANFAANVVLKSNMITPPKDTPYRGGSQIYTAYFHGEPGTGKTSAALALGNILGLRTCYIHLDGKSAEDLVGSPSSETNGKLGLIGECLTQGKEGEENYQNVLMILDEAGAVINQDRHPLRGVLREILDRLHKTIYLPGLKAEVSKDGLVFILTGNEPLKDKSISDRTPSFFFPRFPDKQRKAVAMQTLHEELKLINPELLKNVTEQDWEKFIDELLVVDENPGVRPLQRAIAEYVAYRARQNTLWASSEKFDIEAALGKDPSKGSDKETTKSR